MKYKGKFETALGDEIDVEHSHDEFYTKEESNGKYLPNKMGDNDFLKTINGVELLNVTSSETFCIGSFAQPEMLLKSIIRPRISMPSMSPSDIVVSSDLDNLKFKRLTQAQYNALATKDVTTFYIIVG